MNKADVNESNEIERIKVQVDTNFKEYFLNESLKDEQKFKETLKEDFTNKDKKPLREFLYS